MNMKTLRLILAYFETISKAYTKFALKTTDVIPKQFIKVFVICHKLKFDKHVDIIVRAAYRKLGFLIRNTKAFRNTSCIKFLYNATVRSGLENASQIWKPYHDTYISKLERVQRRFTRHLFYKMRTPPPAYEDRLASSNMLKLSLRRNFLDMSFFFKLVRNELEVDLLNEIQFRVAAFNSRTILLFQNPRTRTDHGRHAIPVNRFQYDYNQNFTSIDIFNLSRGSFSSAVLSLLRSQ